MSEVVQEAPVARTTVQIDDLDMFVRILASWHEQKVKTLKHMLEIPDGTEMTIGEDDSQKVILTGDVLAGFKAGIDLSLMELGELPFLYEAEDNAEPEAVAADA